MTVLTNRFGQGLDGGHEDHLLIVDLIKTTTLDGLQLDGMFQAPAVSPVLAIDAFCLVHGTGGNFYSSSLFTDLADRLLALGCGVLRINTRGHDGIRTAVTARGGKRLGAAYETVGRLPPRSGRLAGLAAPAGRPAHWPGWPQPGRRQGSLCRRP
jgi:hypothetical protein